MTKKILVKKLPRSHKRNGVLLYYAEVKKSNRPIVPSIQPECFSYPHLHAFLPKLSIRLKGAHNLSRAFKFYKCRVQFNLPIDKVVLKNYNDRVFPGRGEKMIYADNAATTKMSSAAINSIIKNFFTYTKLSALP